MLSSIFYAAGVFMATNNNCCMIFLRMIFHVKVSERLFNHTK